VLPQARQPAQSERRFAIWGQGYGGYANTKGDSSVGSPDTTSRVYGFATGLDYRFASDLTAGFALGGAGTSWAYGSNLGGGNSDVFQAGLYGTKRFGAAYVSAAFAYAWQDTSTNRTVTIAGTDQLRGHFIANSFGGRIETGYRLQGGWADITPYAAVQVQNTSLPSYSETVASGSAQFAMTYDKLSSTSTRFELGSWLDKVYALQGGDALALRGRLAWAHDDNGTQGITAGFQAVPGLSFVIDGTEPPKNLALVSSGVQYRFANGLTVGAKFDSELASHSRSYSGSGTVSFTW
jgi:outer membrane autotransporter protein